MLVDHAKLLRKAVILIKLNFSNQAGSGYALDLLSRHNLNHPVKTGSNSPCMMVSMIQHWRPVSPHHFHAFFIFFIFEAAIFYNLFLYKSTEKS